MDAVQPSWSPDGQRLVFWSVEGGRRVLRTIAASGGESAQVFDAPSPKVFWNPVWSSDGRWLYYVSNETGAMTLARVRVDSTGRAIEAPQSIVAPAGWVGQIALSRDGRRLAYQSVNARFELSRAALDPDRGVLSESTTILAGALGAMTPSVSPDGRTIAFANLGSASQEDIFTIDREGRNLRQITNDEALDRGPGWSPDGRRILFYSNRGGRGFYEIWSVNPDGSDPRLAASSPDRDDWMFPRVASTGQLSVIGMTSPSALLTFTSPSASFDRALPPIGNDEAFWPIAWSPDGSALAGFVQSGAAGGLVPDLVIYRPALDKDKYDRLPGAGMVVGWLPGGRRLVVLRPTPQILDLQTRSSTPIGTVVPVGGSFGAGLSGDGRTMYYATVTADSDIWLVTLQK
jgi:Tol biopolymer transport system component